LACFWQETISSNIDSAKSPQISGATGRLGVDRPAHLPTHVLNFVAGQWRGH
jgi:hypothetical protein